MTTGEAPAMTSTPIIELRNVSKAFVGVHALTDVSIQVRPGEVTCLLGDNGAGKSTLIKIMSGVHRPTSGIILLDGQPTRFTDPRDARARGIATVHQYGGTIPLMSVARNFFLGAEPSIGWGPFKRLDTAKAGRIALAEIHQLGIRHIRDAEQLVGTMSGGERQALAIARAMHFGARVLILDEPTSALGVKEAGKVLRLIVNAGSRGVGIVFITHNAHHAMTVGDRFAVLIHGTVAADFRRGEKSREEVLNLMAGGEELESLGAELESIELEDAPQPASGDVTV
jgi:simple sugar transport system ATP-binding protein